MTVVSLVNLLTKVFRLQTRESPSEVGVSTGTPRDGGLPVRVLPWTGPEVTNRGLLESKGKDRGNSTTNIFGICHDNT